eukprot:m51a1_g7569 hypothetical protein (372) ;mRNA; r:167632-169610
MAQQDKSDPDFNAALQAECEALWLSSKRRVMERYFDPSHNRLPSGKAAIDTMLKLDSFWEKEKAAPLFNREHGFLETAGASAFERALAWATRAARELPAGSDNAPRALAPLDDAAELKIPRIVTADAERTFVDPEHRARLARFLTRVNEAFGDYSQSLGYVASLLVLFVPEAQAYDALAALNAAPMYLPGYWKHEAFALNTDAYVFGSLLDKANAEVAAHLKAACIPPETYCQKWFSGLCIHVLPFANLFDFMDGFVEGGFRFSMQFGLSLMNQMKKAILETPITDVTRLFGILRLDPEVVPDCDYAAIVAGAADFKEVCALTDAQYKDLREKMYDTHLRARVEASKRRAEEESDDEIVFSDEEDEEKGDD